MQITIHYSDDVFKQECCPSDTSYSKYSSDNNYRLYVLIKACMASGHYKSLHIMAIEASWGGEGTFTLHATKWCNSPIIHS